MQGIVVFDLAYFAEYLNVSHNDILLKKLMPDQRAAERTEGALNQNYAELIDKCMKDLKVWERLKKCF